jgi:anthranilate phosphoribosyltransferase
MRAYLQRIATGPELSKDLSCDETRAALRLILDRRVDPVQAGVFLIALRMKRESDDENRGVLKALIDCAEIATAATDDVVDIADPYDGYARGLPASPFLPAVLSACGLPSISHGVESVGPKFGVTHRQVLRAAGVNVDLSTPQAAACVANPDIGWAYVDQKNYCPKLHELVSLRRLIVKRPCLSTVEVLVGPIRGRAHTHLITGYVHKAYPRIYALLAREAGFDSALIVRGVEGGVIPSLQKPAKILYYQNSGEDRSMIADPAGIGIDQDTRAVPLPGEPDEHKSTNGADVALRARALAHAAAKSGVDALKGMPGPMRDSLIYGAALCLVHTKRHESLDRAAHAARAVLDTGAAHERFQALVVSASS